MAVAASQIAGGSDKAPWSPGFSDSPVGLEAPEIEYHVSLMAPLVPAGCLLCKRLVREYAQAISDHNRIHCAYLVAILQGEDSSFEGEIARAENRKESVFYAILSHQREHLFNRVAQKSALM